MAIAEGTWSETNRGKLEGMTTLLQKILCKMVTIDKRLERIVNAQKCKERGRSEGVERISEEEKIGYGVYKNRENGVLENGDCSADECLEESKVEVIKFNIHEEKAVKSVDDCSLSNGVVREESQSGSLDAKLEDTMVEDQNGKLDVQESTVVQVRKVEKSDDGGDVSREDMNTMRENLLMEETNAAKSDIVGEVHDDAIPTTDDHQSDVIDPKSPSSDENMENGVIVPIEHLECPVASAEKDPRLDVDYSVIVPSVAAILSWHALLGVERTGGNQTMKLVVCVNKKNQERRVLVANGGRMSCSVMVKEIVRRMQDQKFKAIVLLMSLRGCELILGMEWLHAMRIIKWDFPNHALEFQWEGKPVKLTTNVSIQGQWKDGILSSLHVEMGLWMVQQELQLSSMIEDIKSWQKSQFTWKHGLLMSNWKLVVGNIENLRQKIIQISHSAMPFFKLLSYADVLDWILMALGSLGIIVHGMALPVGHLLLGKALNAFGNNINETDAMVKALKKVIPYVWYVAFAIFPAGILEIGGWMYASEGQLGRLRLAFLSSVLSQEIGAFDTELYSGKVISRITTHMSIIQDAIGEKLGHFLSSFATSFACVLITFICHWEVSLLALFVVPLILIIKATYTKKMNVISAACMIYLSKATTVVEETTSHIKTVFAFVGEKRAIQTFLQHMDKRFMISKGVAMIKGVGTGMFQTLTNCSWALITWVGAVVVKAGRSTGGNVIAAIMSILLGAMWKGLEKYVQIFIRACDVCQRCKHDNSTHSGMLPPLPTPTAIWSEVSMDFTLALHKSYVREVIMVVEDRLTKYTHFIGLYHLFSASMGAVTFLNNIFKLHDCPVNREVDHDLLDRDAVLQLIVDWVYMKLQPYRQGSIRESQIHPTFHVSKLRMGQVTATTLPRAANRVKFPEHGLDMERIKRGNKAITNVWVKWQNGGTEDAAGKFSFDLRAKYPNNTLEDKGALEGRVLMRGLEDREDEE